ncbi:multiubiquitin domain-containing protein [Fodinicola acaciae]|uniref:multiubiquitin domain-containing protein n=1 Tax=Fodinicola acaciae TaxID=2681555 RepID=UPI0013D6D140|nr:multiubiquitin domain-containing protein [Fodinicola acaciae]
MPITSERDATDQHGRPPTRITVTVNGDPVILTDRRMTGTQIKAAAVEQGADLQQDFQLSVKRGHHYDVVGNDEVITVHEGEEFIAVATDENS